MSSSVWQSVKLAFSTFSTIPVRSASWEEGRSYVMAAFPFVGVVVGAIAYAWLYLCGSVGIGSVACAVGLTLIPVIITGGIHLDGFCDVVDAISSHAEPERKRAILKDPHIGAFAAIGVGAYLLAFVGVGSELDLSHPGWQLAGLIFPLSRICSGSSVVIAKSSAQEGMNWAFNQSGATRQSVIALAIEAVVSVGAACAIWLPGGLALALGACLTVVAVLSLAKSQFGGMSGDIAGFMSSCAELAMLICLVVVMAVM